MSSNLVQTVSTGSSEKQTLVGFAYGLASYMWWGTLVFYFKALSHVLPAEVVIHRIIWAAVTILLFLIVTARFHEWRQSFTCRRRLMILGATAALIGTNWLVYVWAITNNRVADTSMGYFINPLVNVLLGFLFLKEKLTRWQVAAVLLAAAGVAVLWIDRGQMPIVSLYLAFSFALYGLLRRQAPVNGISGLAVEMTLLLPLAALGLLYLGLHQQLSFASTDLTTSLLLLSAGIVSALPLIWFVNAAKRLRYAALGMMMYIMPTMTLIFAIFVFGESFGFWRAIAFICIWIGLAVYTVDSRKTARLQRIRRVAADRAAFDETAGTTATPDPRPDEIIRIRPHSGDF